MTAKPTNVRETSLLTEREEEIARLDMLRKHHRHQQRVGTLHRLGRQELSHADHAKKFAHYLSQPHRLTEYRWVRELQAFDFRAYQSKLMGIEIRDHDAYMWWMRLGDEQRYSAIRQGAAAMRDEHEQDKRHRRREQQKRLRESGDV